MHTHAPARRGHVALALAALYLIWGSTYLAIRFALEGGFPPFLLGGIRFLVAGGLLYAFLRLRGVPAPGRAQWANAAVMGVLLLLGGGLFGLGQWVHSNVSGQPATSGTVMLAALPIIVGIQFIIAFLHYDVSNVPTEPLQSDEHD